MTTTISPREAITRDIIRGLYEGRYVPGQRLVESDLTAQYGTSRGPVREALNYLSAQGIVCLTLQRGAQVRRLSVSEAVDILVVVEPLVGLAASLAAARIRMPGAAKTLRVALADLLAFDASSSGVDYAHARDRFYGALIELSGNTELWRLMPRTLVHLVRVQYRDALKPADATRRADYQRIGTHVLAGHGARAENAARVHISRSIAALRDETETQAAQ